jgi:cell wall-associated NlpC family hydrolase
VALTNPLRVRTVVPTRQGPPAPKAVARAKKAGGNEAAIGAWLMHRPGGLPKPPPRPTVAPVAPQRAAGWNPEPVDPTQSLIDKAIAALANSPDPFAQAGPLVQQIIDAENAQAKLAYDQRVAQAQADAQRITGIYSGAATALNALGLPAQAQGAYQGAAHEQTAFAKGYSDGMQKALGKSASKTNSDLAAVGAPQGQMIDPKQATKAGDVLYGLGGAIPGTLLSQQGLSASDSLTGIPAAMIGSGAFYASGNLAQAQKEASDWYAGQLANIAADQPKTLIDLANFYAGQNTQAQNRASSLISAASRTTPVAKPKPYQHVTIGGKAYGFDPNTGRFLDPATGRVVRPVAKAGLGAPPRVNMPLSRSLGRWVDSAGKPIPSLTHVAPPTATSGLRPAAAKSAATAKTVIIGAGGVPLTNSQINAAAVTVRQTVQGGQKLGKRLEDSIRLLRQEGVPEPIIRQTVQKMFVPATTAQLQYMTVGRLHNIAVSLGYQPTGVANKSALVQWITQHFPVPKGRAAAQTAASKGGTGFQVVSWALGQRNTPYEWGGGSPEGPTAGIPGGPHFGAAGTKGYDCSGLIWAGYKKLGIDLPRTSQGMAHAGVAVNSTADLQAGDLLVVNGGKHVVLYVGGGNVVAASSRAGKVVLQPLSLWQGSIVAMRRVV